jgi:hypothetical protein
VATGTASTRPETAERTPRRPFLPGAFPLDGVRLQPIHALPQQRLTNPATGPTFVARVNVAECAGQVNTRAENLAAGAVTTPRWEGPPRVDPR